MLANTASLNRRDRALVTLASVVPDIDGVGVIAEVLTRHSRHRLEWFSSCHHALPRSAVKPRPLAGRRLASFLVARQRWKIAALTFPSFHLHLLEDLLGARGADGYPWPIPYLMPFSHAGTLTWNGQWPLNAFYLSWRRGYWPVEMVSLQADSAFGAALRNPSLPPENKSA